MTEENLGEFKPADQLQQEEKEEREITRASDLIGDTFLTAKMVGDLNLIGEQKIERAVVETIQKEDQPPERKLGLKFEGHSGLILLLNKTNTKRLIEKYGDEFRSWEGRSVNISITQVSYKGKQVDSVQVEVDNAK
jgi:hypothetical protein